MIQFSAEILDNYFSPELSTLVAVDAPSVARPKNWMLKLALNQSLTGELWNPVLVALLSEFNKRLAIATTAYVASRAEIRKYIRALPQHDQLSAHRRAIAGFEQCIVQLELAVSCLDRLGAKLKVETIRGPDRGGPYRRLTKLYNKIKHFESMVINSPISGKKRPQVAPVWIRKRGIYAKGAYITFAELAEILTCHAHDAEELSHVIFQEAVTRRKAPSVDAGTP